LVLVYDYDTCKNISKHWYYNLHIGRSENDNNNEIEQFFLSLNPLCALSFALCLLQQEKRMEQLRHHSIEFFSAFFFVDIKHI
jgi:hypothetical protein